MFIAELEHPEFERLDLSSLRTGIMAGAPCPIAVMRRVVERMHMGEVTIAYGMTETSPVSFQIVNRRYAGAAGRPPSGGCIRMSRSRSSTAKGGWFRAATPGELCTRGYSVMSAYWDEAQKTAEVKDAAGWMHTGDLAVIDAQGTATSSGASRTW